MITREQAGHFANEWIAAWSSHNLPRILAHYTDDFTMASPWIAAVANEPPDVVVVEKQSSGAYWQKALALTPTLQFKRQAAFVGADSVAIQYEGVRGPAIENLFFNEAGLWA